MQFLKSRSQRRTATWLAVFMLSVAVFVWLAPSVLAQASLGIEVGEGTGLGSADLKLIITRVIQIALGFLGIVAVALLIYGGYIWLTSQGNEEKISQAKRILVNAVVGLVIIIAAFSIVTYIISRLQEATVPGGEGGRDVFYSINAGALGGGVLQNVYPEPGAIDVPRNTLIMVTFKEAMDIESIIDTDSHPQQCQNAPEGSSCGYLKIAGDNPTTRIINRSAGNLELAANEVIVMTNDGKSFVYDPILYLGSADATSNYSVNLTDQVNKATGAPAFLIGGYLWSFAVSSVLDLTPPQVESLVPVSPPPVPKNTTVQINFNEAVNVVTATGRATGNPAEPLNTILISYENEAGQLVFMTGTAAVSNFFRTVEFISDVACEVDGQPAVNSCGETPTCFPGNEDFLALVKAALVDEQGNLVDLFSGITDAAGNSLDGNGNGQPEGQPADNFAASFSTTDDMDLTPPEIISPLVPAAADQAVARNQSLKVIFNEYILGSSLTAETYTVFESACGFNLDYLPNDLSCYPEGGFVITKQNINNNQEINSGRPATRVILRTYHPYLNPLTNYNSRLTSGIKDTYQNCYSPAIGPCAPGQASPSCQ